MVLRDLQELSEFVKLHERLEERQTWHLLIIRDLAAGVTIEDLQNVKVVGELPSEPFQKLRVGDCPYQFGLTSPNYFEYGVVQPPVEVAIALHQGVEFG